MNNKIIDGKIWKSNRKMISFDDVKKENKKQYNPNITQIEHY